MPLLTVSARLQHTSSLITNTSSRNTRPPGPFTHSLLGNVPIVDLIRDADETERRLVRLEGDELGKREVALAVTGGAGKARASRVGMLEESVEVYAGAALELVEEYESMPRAKQHILSLLSRSVTLHESITTLQAALASAQSETPEQSSEPAPTSLQAVEAQVRELEAKIASSRQKRDILRARLRDVKLSGPSPSVSPVVPVAPPPRRVATPRADEGNNPFLARGPLSGASGILAIGSLSARKQSIESRASDESTERAESPTPLTSSTVRRRGVLGLEEEDAVDKQSFMPAQEEEVEEPEEEEEEEEPEQEEDADDTEIEEPTVVLRRPVLPAAPPQPSPVRPTQPNKLDISITPAMELAVAKIWNTSTGLSLEPALEPGATLPAEETLALLDKLVNWIDPPQSPEKPPSTLSSLLPGPHPTPDTILLARLLLNILTAPSLHVPLNALKDLLRQFAVEKGFDEPGEKALRAVYGGVGRGVVRIDRARGVVLFA